MQTINIHQAKTHLSKLVEKASHGESFIIAKAGKPLVKVIPLDSPETNDIQRIGFLENQIKIPEDFDEMGKKQIEQLFNDTK